MIPTINTRGVFTFAAPYDTLVSSTQQYTVVSIRSLAELQASREDPLANIYIAAGELESVFLTDLANDVPVVTLRTDGNEYIYVPANKIISDAKLDGVKYIEKTVIVNLGYLPVDTNTATVKGLINDVVYDSIGVTPDILVTDTSASVYVEVVKHDTLTVARNSKKSVDKSFQTRYLELLALYDRQQVLLNNVRDVYVAKGIGA